MIRAPLLLVLVAMVAVPACTHQVDETTLLYPHRGAAVNLEALGREFPAHAIRREWIRAGDGTRLSALHFERGDAIASVLYFGGNGYTVGNFAAATAGAYRDLPVDLVLVDHRGYGDSGGRASVQALLDDAAVVYRHARVRAGERGLPVIVHGHSLGSFLAGELAAAHRLDGLVLESSVTTVEDWAGHFHAGQPWWVRMLVREVVPAPALAGRGNSAVVAALDEPVLFLVGEGDTLTPPEFTRQLHARAGVPDACKRLVVAPGRGHDGATRSEGFRTGARWLLSVVQDPGASCSPAPAAGGAGP